MDTLHSFLLDVTPTYTKMPGFSGHKPASAPGTVAVAANAA